MRRAVITAGCLAALVLSMPGCFESLSNIATPDKVVYYDDLVGDYKAVHPGTGRLTLAKEKQNAYAYQLFDEKGALVHKGTLWLVKLGDGHFYQVSVDGYVATDGRPMFAIGRLLIEGGAGAKTLTGYTFKSKATLFGDALVTTTEYEYVEAGERKKGVALAMPPDKLQTYLAVRAAEMNEPTLKFQQTPAGR